MNKYWRAFLKTVIASFILIVGFLIFYSIITKDDPTAKFDIDSIIDNTTAWVDYKRYQKDLEQVSFFNQLEVEFIGDTTRLNFSTNHLKYYFEKCYDKNLKTFPYVDPVEWLDPLNVEYRDNMRRRIGDDPEKASMKEIGKMSFTVRTWRLGSRTVYYKLTYVVGTEADPYVYDDFRFGNCKRTVLVEIIERNMEMMTRIFAKKFYYLRGEPHLAPRVEKI